MTSQSRLHAHLTSAVTPLIYSGICRAGFLDYEERRTMAFSRTRILSALSLILIFVSYAWAAGPNISLAVDATEAPRKILHARLRIPATPGTLTLYYPKWLPGEHSPTGPVVDLAGLKFSASGKPLKWRRDLLDGWTLN